MGKSEEWKQIKDFPNYYISNKGRVASNGMKQGNTHESLKRYEETLEHFYR